MNIADTRFQGFTDTIDWYMWRAYEGYKLSDEQKKQLREIKDIICVWGEKAVYWINVCEEILSDNLTINKNLFNKGLTTKYSIFIKYNNKKVDIKYYKTMGQALKAVRIYKAKENVTNCHINVLR